MQILLGCWQYQRQHEGLKLYGYVVLDNHLHFIAQTPRLDKCVSSFKAYTAHQLIDYLKQRHVERLLTRLSFSKRVHKPRKISCPRFLAQALDPTALQKMLT